MEVMLWVDLMILLPGHLCGMGPESCRQAIFLMISSCISSLISFLCRFSTVKRLVYYFNNFFHSFATTDTPVPRML